MSPVDRSMPTPDGPGRSVDADAVADWTRGSEGLAYQRCPACAHVWAFRRAFCPACGDRSPLTEASSGRGSVYATTLVQRAPSDAFASLAPYRIVLVDLAEGVRVMAHGDPALAIGDAVVCGFFTHDGRVLPRFRAA